MKELTTAKEFLHKALGNNMNIRTLKPLAWYEIMAQYANLFHKENTKSTPEALKDIEWSGECPDCDKGKLKRSFIVRWEWINCPRCNGTGTITRPATIEEASLFIKEALGHKTCHPKNIKVNNGTLRMKDQK